MISKINQFINRQILNVISVTKKICRPITDSVTRLCIRMHINQSHISLSRILLLIFFCLFWTRQQFVLSIVCLTLSLLLDGIDGDIARKLGRASGMGKFEDLMADNLVLVAYPLALISQNIIHGFLGAYFIFISFLSWWFSIVRNPSRQDPEWFFTAENGALLGIFRLVLTVLIYLYVFSSINIFPWTLFVISIILTLTTIFDYYQIVKTRLKF